MSKEDKVVEIAPCNNPSSSVFMLHVTLYMPSLVPLWFLWLITLELLWCILMLRDASNVSEAQASTSMIGASPLFICFLHYVSVVINPTYTAYFARYALSHKKHTRAHILATLPRSVLLPV